MNQQLPLKRIVAAGLGAVFLSAAAAALADPPARIARLAYIDGPVSFAPAGENRWEFAAVNRPLIAGDRLWVEAGGRDEVQLGGAALRMGGNTLVTLLNIDDRTTQLQLSQGRLNVRIRHLRPNEVFEIDTPNLALSIRQPGDYRIDVDPVGNLTMVAVQRGQAEAYGDGNAYRLGSGQAYIFGGTDLRDVRYARPDLNDDFDRWSASRDRRIEQARSVRYVSPDLVGYEDLDDQGTWTTVANYGNVWMPSHVGRDWAPYRDGHWAYVQPWGWTWVDDAPWGFAVSHYGRWARFPQGWGWVPGPRAASPVYAPALVAFVSFGAGAYAQRERPVAWFPLAPREVYRPSYRASPNYITNINVTNTALGRHQIPREGNRVEYANRRGGGAVTAVPASAFAHSQPVSRSAVALPMAALAGAAIAHMAPVAPEREGRRGRGNPGHQPPQAVIERQVLAKNAPPRPGVNNAAPAQQMAGPAPRTLPQDRRGGGRQLRDVPMQQPAVAGSNSAPPAMPQQDRGRFDRHGDQRMQRGQQGAAPMSGQAGVAPLATAPMPPQGRGRDRIEPPPLAPAPAAALRDQQSGPDAHRRGMRPEQGAPGQQRMDQQAAAAQQQAAQQQQHNQRQAAERQRNLQQAEAHQRQQAAEQQRSQQRDQQQAAAQQRAQQQQAAEQQRAQQQAAAGQQRVQQQAAAEQRRAERAQRREPPPPQAAAPAPAAAQPASAPQQGPVNEGKKEDRRRRDRPEQN